MNLILLVFVFMPVFYKGSRGQFVFHPKPTTNDNNKRSELMGIALKIIGRCE